jgi:hypothetical protein
MFTIVIKNRDGLDLPAKKIKMKDYNNFLRHTTEKLTYIGNETYIPITQVLYFHLKEKGASFRPPPNAGFFGTRSTIELINDEKFEFLNKGKVITETTIYDSYVEVKNHTTNEVWQFPHSSIKILKLV